MRATRDKYEVCVQMTTITAYAQPAKEAPYLLLKAIKRGRVKWVKRSPFYMELNVTDVGAAVWKAMYDIDPDTVVRFVKAPYHKRLSTDTEQRSWHLEFTAKQFKIGLYSQRYIPLKRDPDGYAIIVEINADKELIRRILSSTVATLGDTPTAFTDLDALCEAFEIAPSAAVEAWERFGGTKPPGEATTAEEEDALRTEIDRSMTMLKSMCRNPKMIQQFEMRFEKGVYEPLQRGKLETARSHAEPLLAKIGVIQRTISTSMDRILKFHRRIEQYEERGVDTAASDRHLERAENALRKLQKKAYQSEMRAAKRALDVLAEGATSAPTPAPAPSPAPSPAPAPSPPKKKLMSFDLALREEPGATAEPDRPTVEEIASFVRCAICDEKLADRTLTQCPECGKRYHSDCVRDTNTRACLVCGRGLPTKPAPEEAVEAVEAVEGAAEAADAGRAVTGSHAARSEAEIEIETEIEAEAEVDAEAEAGAASATGTELITSFVICGICRQQLGDRPLVQCPECGKRYHLGCGADLEKCRTCRTGIDAMTPIVETLLTASDDEERLADTEGDDIDIDELTLDNILNIDLEIDDDAEMDHAA